jgi:glycosyltransferase involved in cell wall biosynthesis
MDRKTIASIIVPTRNRPTQLSACLQSLARLEYPKDQFEVIVVDDGSIAPPDAIVRGFKNKISVELLIQLHAGPAAARNTGAARARGRILAFTDDDCQPAPDWLEKLTACFDLAPDCAIGGRTLNALPENSYSKASQVLIDYLYTYHNADPNRASFLTSNNLAMPADRFRAVGGFDAEWLRAAAEDRELCDRWLCYGNRLIYAPEALVYHAHPLTFRTFWQQHFNYGRGAFYFHRARAFRGQCRLRIERLKFYSGLLRYPSSQPCGRQALLLAKLLCIAQVANAGGFFWESVASRRRLKGETHVGGKLRSRPVGPENVTSG